jgi:hypothetical protein
MGCKAHNLETILSKTVPDKDTDCMIWTGGLSRDGRYGSVSYYDKTYRVHRLVYQLFYQDNPGKLHILHHCDRPLCINPSHLFKGNEDDNKKIW